MRRLKVFLLCGFFYSRHNPSTGYPPNSQEIPPETKKFFRIGEVPEPKAKKFCGFREVDGN